MTASNFRLVLMPGLDGTGELFEWLRAELPPKFDIVTLRYPTDRIQSYRDLYPTVIEACEGASSVVLFGESFSSPLALEIAASGLSNLSGLILCAGFASPPFDGILATALRNIPASLLHLSPPDWAIRRYLIGIDAPSELTQRVKQTIANVPPQIFRQRLNEVLTFSAMESVARVKVPMLYLQASDDQLVPSTAFEEIASANDRAVRIVISGPHLLAQANPSVVATAIMNFIHTLA